jgi:hypothetical protein
MTKKSGNNKNPNHSVADLTEPNLINPAGAGLTSDVKWLAGVLFVCLFYLVLKMFTMHPYSSDEFIYLSQGKMVADGLVPYKDFPMAHPPLQALFTAALFKLFGYDFVGFRLIGTLWALIAGVLLSIVVKREYGSVASVFSLALYILAYEPLRASIHFTGVNMTIALLMAALLAFRLKNVLFCAIMCVLAVYTRLYALPAVLAILISSYLSDKKETLKLVMYGGGFGALLFVVFGMWTGFAEMSNDIFLFQAQKTAMGEEKLSFMRDAVLFHNAVPFFLFILGALTLIIAYFKTADSTGSKNRLKSKAVSGDKQDYSLLWLSVSSVILILGILLNMDRVWMYYFVLAFPFGAIIGGWMVSVWLLNYRSLLNLNTEAKRSFVSPVWLRVSLALFIVFYLVSPRFERRLEYYKTAMRDPQKKTATYVWRDGHLPSGVNSLMKSLFWKDVRVVGDNYSSFTFFLWHSSRVIDFIFEVADEVKKRAKAGDTVFGDSGTTPLISLLTQLGIAGNEVDTNIERYRSGNASAEELARKIDIPSTRFVVLRDKFGVAVLPEIQQLVNRNYKEVKSWRSPTGFTLRLFERLPSK